MVVCREASLFSDFYQKSPHLLAVRAQSDIIRVTCTSLAVDKTSRVSESLDLNWQPLLDSRESMGYSSSFKGGLLSEAPHRQLVKWLKSRNILSCSQNQSGPGLIESRELIPFSLLPQYRSFSLLDTLSPPHLYPTPSWFSTGRALDSCSGLTHFTTYTGMGVEAMLLYTHLMIYELRIHLIYMATKPAGKRRCQRMSLQHKRLTGINVHQVLWTISTPVI